MQSRMMSLVEAVTNVLVGFGIATLVQVILFPFFGLEATLGEHMVIGAIFTVVSIARSYGMRRMFNAWGTRRSRS